MNNLQTSNHTPPRLASAQLLLALAEITKRRNYLELSRQILNGLSEADLTETDFRVGVMLLEAGPMIERDESVIHSNWSIANADGAMDDKQVLKSLKRMKAVKIIEEFGAGFRFKPLPWASSGLRAKGDRIQTQRAIKDTMNEIAAQLELRLFELNDQLQQLFLEGVDPTPSGVGLIPGSTPGSVGSTPTANTHITFNRSNVKTIKRSEHEVGDGELCEQLRGRVKVFVGELDFQKYWSRSDYIWSDPDRVRSLARSLDYLAAGVESSEVKIRTTAGQTLWDQAQRDWHTYQRKRAGEAA